MDKIDKLNERLKEVVEKFKALKECGIDVEILETYVVAKTKLSKKNVKLVLKEVETFYHKLLNESILKEL